MTKLSHIYPDFSAISAEMDNVQVDDGLAEQKLGAFEDGYQAGWADAVKATESEEAAILDEFKQCLQDNAFTYQEVLGKLCAALHPLLREIAQKVLPRILRDSQALHLTENLERLLKDNLAESATISLSPATKQIFDNKIESLPSTSIMLVADGNLADGQMLLNVQPSELQIDLDQLLAGIDAAIEAHFTT